MGQKVHPIGIRLGISKDWNSTWYAERGEYAEMLNSDLAVREYLQKRLAQAAVSRIQIERPAKTARITIHTARPGIVIGKKGEDIERLRQAAMLLEQENELRIHADVVWIKIDDLAQAIEHVRDPGSHRLHSGRHAQVPRKQDRRRGRLHPRQGVEEGGPESHVVSHSTRLIQPQGGRVAA